ncbi:MFS transporter [Pseudomonas entomophila]|uniref:MFS transporter n=1 Tax=Pseudomonas entomophila TaxID=312306 RepID=UPI0023D7F00B|nr:MFS transporter [Pseudomonas entomophila]MDF0732739.1 MFS transporter [Pseudomonas entomophila]
MSEPSGRLVALMAAGCALAVSTLYYHQPLLAQMAATFGLTPTQASPVATLTQLGYAVGLLLIVPLADARQPRRLAGLAIAANALALLACALAPSFVLLCAASFAVGVTAITAQLIIPTLAGAASPANRGRVVGSLLGGLSSGLLLARTLGGLLGAHAGWQAVFAMAALVDLALLALVTRGLPLTTPKTKMGYAALLRSLASLLREEPVLRVCAASGLLMFAAFSALWASLAALLSQPPYAFGPATIGLLGLVALLGILASPRIGALADRLGTRRTVGLGVGSLVAGFVLVADGGHSLAALMLGMVLLDLGNRAGLVANQARVQALRPEARSRLNTVFMCAYFLGGAAGAALGSYGAHRAGWVGLAAVGGALAGAAGAVNALARATRLDQDPRG